MCKHHYQTNLLYFYLTDDSTYSSVGYVEVACLLVIEHSFSCLFTFDKANIHGLIRD